MSQAYIALGSNLNNPASQLQQAVTAIEALPDSTILAISSVYRSEAVGPGDQADYLNAVLALRTRLSPADLLCQLQALEDRQGRVRTIRWGERTLDLDILLYDKNRVKTDTLEIPHAEMQHRNFVLYPLAEISGTELMLPCGTDLGTLLRHCPRGDLCLAGINLQTNSNAE